MTNQVLSKWHSALEQVNRVLFMQCYILRLHLTDDWHLTRILIHAIIFMHDHYFWTANYTSKINNHVLSAIFHHVLKCSRAILAVKRCCVRLQHKRKSVYCYTCLEIKNIKKKTTKLHFWWNHCVRCSFLNIKHILILVSRQEGVFIALLPCTLLKFLLLNCLFRLVLILFSKYCLNQLSYNDQIGSFCNRCLIDYFAKIV